MDALAICSNLPSADGCFLIQAVSSSTSVPGRERVGEAARMASSSAHVQFAEREAAAARSRYVCRMDMAPALAALRHAKRPAAPEPGMAAPPAPMPISETTTSWLVVMSLGARRTAKQSKPGRRTS